MTQASLEDFFGLLLVIVGNVLVMQKVSFKDHLLWKMGFSIKKASPVQTPNEPQDILEKYYHSNQFLVQQPRALLESKVLQKDLSSLKITP